MRAIRWLVVAGLFVSLAPLSGLAAPAWVPVSPNGGTLVAIAYSPSSPRIAYAADPAGLIFRSEDDAVSWQAAGRLARGAVDLLVDPDDPAILYVRNLEGHLFRSTDRGATWVDLEVDPYGVTEVVAEAHHPGFLLAAAPSQGVLRSTDRGDTWSVAALPGSYVISIASDPFAAATLFAVVGRAEIGDVQTALRSTDGGLTWGAIPLIESPTGLSEDQPHFVFDPAHPGTVYAFYDRYGEDYAGQVFRSLDGGDTWTEPSPAILLRDLAVTTDGTLFGTDFFGVLISRDQGDSWAPLPDAPRAPLDIITRVAASPASPGTVLAAGYQGLWKSTDSGGRWRNPSRGIPIPYISSIAVPPTGRSKVLALAGSRVFESTNRGATWRRLHSEFVSPEPFSLTFDPQVPDRIYGTTYDYVSNFPVRSDTGGRTWHELPFPYSCGGSLCAVDFGAFALDPTHADTLYASGTYFIHFVGYGSYFVRSRDGGRTWKGLRQPEDLIGMAFDPGRAGVLYGLSRKRLYKSEDEARTWSRVGRGLPLTGQRTVAIDPRDGRRIYVGNARGIFASEDGGVTFHTMGEGLEGKEVDTILIDPVRPNHLYAAGIGTGVFSWNARERRFTPLDNGLPVPHYYFPLALDPREPAALYSGSDGSGLLRLDLEE